MHFNLDFTIDKCKLFQAKLVFSKPCRRVLIGRGWDTNLWGTNESILDKFMRLNLDFSVDKSELFQAKLHFSEQKLLFSNPFRRVQIGRNCDKNHGGTP
jgi:hypothetical protein